MDKTLAIQVTQGWNTGEYRVEQTAHEEHVRIMELVGEHLVRALSNTEGTWFEDEIQKRVAYLQLWNAPYDQVVWIRLSKTLGIKLFFIDEGGPDE